MRHKLKKYSLNRFTSWRKATLKGLARSILIHGRIKTTLTRAKACRPLVEKLVSLSKLNTLASRRRAFAILGDHKLVVLLFNEIGPLFKSRVGGYTRIVRMGLRRGDDAKLVFMEFTEAKKVTKKTKRVKASQPQESHPQEAQRPQVKEEESSEEKKPKAQEVKTQKPPITKKPPKSFLGGIRNIFRKKSDSL